MVCSVNVHFAGRRKFYSGTKKNICPMKNALMILVLLFSQYSFSQSKESEKAVRAGNEFYKQQQFARATEEYTKAVETDPANTIARFNQANAFYKQDKK